MSDTELIIYTAFATVIGGMILFILSEFIRIIFVDQIQKLREQITSALSKVDFHRNMLTNYFPSDPSDEDRKTIHAIKKDLRSAATDINSKYAVIPLKKQLTKLKLIPSPERIDVAYRGLIYLHNSILYSGKRDLVLNEIEMNRNEIDRIKAALNGKDIPDIIKPKEKRNYS